MLTNKPQGLRSDELYCYIMQYLAINTGKVITPSLITTTINKCLGYNFTTNKTVSKYLSEICKSNLVHEIEREYITLSDKESNKLGYNRTYYFVSFNLFDKFYNYATTDLFKHTETNEFSHNVTLAKMVFYHKCIHTGYNVKSGVLSFFTHLEGGKTKKNTLSFDFILKNETQKIYVVFQNSKDFIEEEFTVETKFALQNIINKLSVFIITSSSKFQPLEIDGFRYLRIDEILANKFEI